MGAGVWTGGRITNCLSYLCLEAIKWPVAFCSCLWGHRNQALHLLFSLLGRHKCIVLPGTQKSLPLLVHWHWVLSDELCSRKDNVSRTGAFLQLADLADIGFYPNCSYWIEMQRHHKNWMTSHLVVHFINGLMKESCIKALGDLVNCTS